jgi:hypothetical protein
MKKVILSISAFIIIASCKKIEVKETEKIQTELTEKKMDTIANFDRKYPFSEYKVELNETDKKAEINFEKDKQELPEIRNNFIEQYKNGKINFAGNYILTTQTCGSGCKTGAIVDVRNGKLYGLPQLEDQEGNSYDSTQDADEYNNILTDKESKLLITFDTYGREENVATKTISKTRIYRYWEWNEENKKFKLLKQFAEKFNKKI